MPTYISGQTGRYAGKTIAYVCVPTLFFVHMFRPVYDVATIFIQRHDDGVYYPSFLRKVLCDSSIYIYYTIGGFLCQIHSLYA